MWAEIFESKVATVTSSVCDNDPAPRTDTFADYVDRVLWSVGVLGLPCMWMPEKYGGSTFVNDSVAEARDRILSPAQAGADTLAMPAARR